ncbi:hypothetical protein VOLCADRAFT_91666 [Volvox carteri f. nagariensis]|uniref:Methyltransferase small domain-containing protein n=1 Tax=Volvox carteri f. nagariensis TaxID=3068 RepID=D8TXP1_VOLCA|nr:uncharacterized protein VOLCADRAFT_91666 [Volvox carteri f. nagariensis]EFJ47758.1 hypothetical protein VOLCADRAFT_91666 [Volvox carteri f. nagariensis]|eukprot:XP_002951229.1 hypothetical protein VOLCADRAFT_91666 [Volvox carteri f. nagariensis]
MLYCTSSTWKSLSSAQHRTSQRSVACVIAHAAANGHGLPTAATKLAASAVASAAASLRLGRLETGTPVPWARLGPSLDLIQQRLQVGRATFRLITPGDVDAVMDMYLEQNQLDADPYWTRAWPSAIALAATLLQRPELVAGKVVADLGAGLGLAGMAAALAGAKEVVLLDREPAALQCALLSAAATGLNLDLESDGADLLDPESLGRSRTVANIAAGTATATATANGGKGWTGKKGRRKVEPLPSDQLSPYAVLQLTPPYKHLMQEQDDGGDDGYNPQQRIDQQALRRRRSEAEEEWRVLMTLAGSLGCAAAAAAAPAVEPSPSAPPHALRGEEGCSRESDSSSGAASTAVPATSARESEFASTSVSPHGPSSSTSRTPSSPSPSLAVSDVGADEPPASSSSSSSSRDDWTGSSCGEDGGRGSGSSCVLRAHVFDWTAPPEMDRLLPPASTSTPSQQQQRQQQHSPQREQGRITAVRQRRFDVVLACDVLYEDAAVGPIAGLMPILLRPDGGRLLLADPPNRTVRNRERFLQEVRSGPLRLSVEECSLQRCEVSKLDNEMAGGLSPTVETVPVQFLVFRSGLGNDTVGLKL